MPPQGKKGLQKLVNSDESSFPIQRAEVATYHDIVNTPNEYQPISQQNNSLLPQFLRNPSIQLGKSSTENLEARDVAHVHPFNPRIIHVDTPDMFDDSVMAHEATHVFQYGRQTPPLNSYDVTDGHSIYNYGGLEGLQKLRNSGGTINSLTNERQAAMVEEFNRAHKAIQSVYAKQGYLTPEQSKYFEDKKAAFEPFIKQLANLPAYNPDLPSDYNWDKYRNEVGALPNKWFGAPPDASAFPPPTIPAPGLPPGYISGITDPSLEYGGQPMKTKIGGLNNLPKKK